MTFFVILVLFLPAGWKIDPQQNLVDKSLFESSGFGRSLADVSTAKQIRQERAREDPATMAVYSTQVGSPGQPGRLID